MLVRDPRITIRGSKHKKSNNKAVQKLYAVPVDLLQSLSTDLLSILNSLTSYDSLRLHISNKNIPSFDNVFKRYFKINDNHIQLYNTYNDGKSVFGELFILTLI